MEVDFTKLKDNALKFINAKQEKLYSATDQMFTPTHTPGLGAARQRGASNGKR